MLNCQSDTAPVSHVYCKSLHVLSTLFPRSSTFPFELSMILSRMLQAVDEKLTVGHVFPPHTSDSLMVTVFIVSIDPAALLSDFSTRGSVEPAPLSLTANATASPPHHTPSSSSQDILAASPCKGNEWIVSHSPSTKHRLQSEGHS